MAIKSSSKNIYQTFWEKKRTKNNILSPLKKIEERGLKFRSHIDGKLLYLTPEKCIKFQQNIGSDIIMVLDECTNYHVSKSKAEASVELTLRWAKRCRRNFNSKKNHWLFVS